MIEPNKPRICVLGAGSLGGVFSNLIASRCCVDLFSVSGKRVENQCNLARFPVKNKVNLKDLRSNIPNKVLYQTIFFCVPSRAVSNTCKRVQYLGLVPRNTILVSLSKGLERETGLTMSQVLSREFPENRVAVISGGSHAEEVSRSLPFSPAIGSQDREVILSLRSMLSAPFLKINPCSDPRVLEIPAALKNIVAWLQVFLMVLVLGITLKVISYLKD